MPGWSSLVPQWSSAPTAGRTAIAAKRAASFATLTTSRSPARARALCDRARAELLLAGGRPRPTASAGPDTLTAAERRIAEIAIQGATNREIARRLYLSTKTVEMHLHSIYRKLDITGRRQLNVALQQDRPPDASNTGSPHAHATGTPMKPSGANHLIAESEQS
jgi:DNA-binding CsgD family transcriptional regulator